MKRLLLILLCLFAFEISYSSHFKAADISLVNVKDLDGASTNNYKFQVRYYASSNNFINNITLSVRVKGTGALVATIPCTLQGQATVFNYPSSACHNYLNNLTFRSGLYESGVIDLSGYNNTNNYYVTTTDITNGQNYLNIKFENSTFLHYSEFPRLDNNSTTKFNSLPRFNAHPVFYACLNNMVMLDYSAIDIDGDSLAYSLIIPPSSSTVANTYKPGYSASNYIGGNPKLTLDHRTGIAYLSANMIGIYFVAIKVEEFRNGVKISEVTRQHEIDVIANCPTSMLDEKPEISINNQSRKNLTLSYNLGDTVAKFSLTISDYGATRDSLYINILDDNKSGKSFSNLDLTKFNWTKSINGNPQNIGKYNFEEIDTQIVYLNFNFKLYADLFNNLSGKYHFKVLIRDSKCAAANFDTVNISLDFIKRPTIINVANQSGKKGDNVSFKIESTNLNGVNFAWQTDFGQGFQDIKSNNYYSNVDSQTLRINNVQLRNHQQKIRGIIYNSLFSDTSNIAELTILDTTITNVYDTIYVRVADTLFIKLLPLTVPPLDLNVIKIYPNPSTGKLFITCNSANQLQNYYYEISNQLGQIILNGDFNISSREIDLYTWGLKGLYHFNIRENGTQKLIESKKIVLE